LIGLIHEAPLISRKFPGYGINPVKILKPCAGICHLAIYTSGRCPYWLGFVNKLLRRIKFRKIAKCKLLKNPTHLAEASNGSI
jgi:hypothetical protein